MIMRINTNINNNKNLIIISIMTLNKTLNNYQIFSSKINMNYHIIKFYLIMIIVLIWTISLKTDGKILHRLILQRRKIHWICIRNFLRKLKHFKLDIKINIELRNIKVWIHKEMWRIKRIKLSHQEFMWKGLYKIRIS